MTNETKSTIAEITVYDFNFLETGTCTSCGDKTDEIMPDDDRCVDCIQEQKFYEETMKGL